MFEPVHFYWLRGTLSREIAQYRLSFPRAGGQSSLAWSAAFIDYVRSNSSAIWAGAHLNDSSQYRHVNMAHASTVVEKRGCLLSSDCDTQRSPLPEGALPEFAQADFEALHTDYPRSEVSREEAGKYPRPR